MPKVNLRLTDEEHAALTAWAQNGRRSIQREIIWRLFTIEGNQAPKVGPETTEERTGISVQAEAQPRDIPSRTIYPAPAEDHFKPDFKEKRK